MRAIRFNQVLVSLAAAIPLTLGVTAHASQDNANTWQPSKGEFIVPAGPGAGLDASARMLVHLLQQHNRFNNMIVVNRPGGNNTIAMNVLNERPGDGNYVMTFTSSILNHEIIGNVSGDYTEYTPIATLFDEHVAVVVGADSPYKTIHDLIAKFKESPGELNVGVAASVGNHVHVGIARPLKMAGVDISKLTVVPYKSSSESMVALLGGHLDVVAATTPSLVAPLQANSVRVLAVGAPKRLGGVFAQVPTWIDSGINVVPGSSQGVLGPRNMSQAQLDYWSKALDEVVATKEWQDLLAKNYWNPNYLGPEETRKFRAREYQGILETLTELGLAKR